MTDFNALLDRKGSSFEKPKPLPAGHFEGVITKMVLKDVNMEREGSKVDVPIGEMFIRATAPRDDVDADALEAYGGLSDRSILRKTWWLEEESVHQFITFCETALGFDPDNTLRQHIDEVVNQGVLMEVINVPKKGDPETVYANIADGGLAQL